MACLHGQRTPGAVCRCRPRAVLAIACNEKGQKKVHRNGRTRALPAFVKLIRPATGYNRDDLAYAVGA